MPIKDAVAFDKAKSRYLGIILSLVSVFLGMALLLLSLIIWGRFHVNVPVKDLLPQLPLIQTVLDGSGVGTIADWVAPHAGAHRILVVRILMLGDYLLFKGGNQLIYLSTWSGLSVLLLLYFRTFRIEFPDFVYLRWFLFGILLIYLFAPGQYWVLIDPINSVWPVSLASGAASIWLMLSSNKDLSVPRAVAVCCLASIAAFSCFAGVVECVMLLALALFDRSKNAWFVFFYMALFVALYVHGFQTGSNRPTSSPAFMKWLQHYSAQHPGADFHVSVWEKILRDTHLTLLNLGSPLSGKRPILAQVLVALSLTYIGFNWVRFLLNQWGCGQSMSRPIRFYLIMATICLGISVATWMGRIMFADPHAPRYQTVVMVYWMSMSCMFVAEARYLEYPGRSSAVMLVVLGITLLLIRNGSDYSLVRSIRMGQSAKQMQSLASLGETDLSSYRAAFPKGLINLSEKNYQFLSRYGFALPIIGSPPAQANPKFCSRIKWRLSDTRWQGVRRVRLQLKRSFGWYNDIFVINAGRIVGRLYNVVPATSKLLSLVSDQGRWSGFYRVGAKGPTSLNLYFDPLAGGGFRCPLE